LGTVRSNWLGLGGDAHFAPLAGLGLRYVAAFALLGFVFSSNTFPPIAWHTIDALFLLSLGLVLRIRFCRFNFLAYFLIGAAYLCKQTFAAAFFGALIATGDWRRPRYWVAALLPATIYFALLSRVGALSDAVVQLTAQRGIFDPGVRSYVMTPYVPWGILSGIGLGWLIHYNKRSPSTLGLWAVCTGLCGCALALLVRGMYWFGKVPGYGLFGVTLGLLISALLYAHALSFVRAGLLVLAAAWCTSISVGFNSPNLAAGPLACFVLIAAIALTRPMIAERHISYVVSVMLIVALTSFTVARWHWTYRDAPAAKLTGKLGGIFPGAKSIRTNANTLAYLQDLQLAISRVHGHPYIILPDTAAYWVRSSELNPISSDWPLYIELANDALVHRVERDLERQKGKSVILLEKIAVEDLATGFRPLVQDNYPILPYVHKNFRKIDETKFFDILD